MTILNLQSDGLPPVLITLAMTVAKEREISRDNLIDMCSPPADISSDKEGDTSPSAKVRATLNRWTSFGLFEDVDGKIKLRFAPKRGETSESFELRLPGICTSLLVQSEVALPLWPHESVVSEDNIGRSADLCRGLAWCLAQDIYDLPSVYKDVDTLVRSQIEVGRFVFLNDTRWTGLRSWARYLGFATGTGAGFLFDPTIVVRAQLKEVMQEKESLVAAEFVSRLAARVPVLDRGIYRTEVEQALRTQTWRAPATDHLSSSLSIALRRLQKQGTIALESMADAGSRLALTGQFGRTWQDFTHVRLLRSAE
jgi:hypothetical protein